MSIGIIENKPYITTTISYIIRAVDGIPRY